MDIKKLWSRKLLIAVASSALIALGQQLGLSDQTVQGIMAVISAFLIAQGWVDGKAAEAAASVKMAEVDAKLHLDMSRLNASRAPWKAEGSMQATSLTPFSEEGINFRTCSEGAMPKPEQWPIGNFDRGAAAQTLEKEKEKENEKARIEGWAYKQVPVKESHSSDDPK